MIFDLRSGSLDTTDPEEIVRSVAEELRANTLVALDIRVSGEWEPRLSPEQAGELHQLVHEAFSNILRHARARRVTVRLARGRRRLRLEIADDGIGFDADPAERRDGGEEQRRGEGMANMRRRAELLGATLHVRSALAQGTSLSLTMPVTAARRVS